MRKILLFCLLPSFALAQTKSGYYAGFLKGPDGTPVTNAVIYNNNNGDRTFSGNEGYYVIEVSSGDTLLIRFANNTTQKIGVPDYMIQAKVPDYQPAILEYAAPVRSTAYMQKVGNDSSHALPPWLKNLNFQEGLQYFRMQPYVDPSKEYKKMKNADGTISLKPLIRRHLMLRGSYTVNWAVRQVNQEPDQQKTFAQGRPVNNQLQWQGPEMGELFSFGPAIASLEFDGSKYDYDQNGRLVPKGSGNGHAANGYTNTPFRNGMFFSQLLSLQGQGNYIKSQKNFTLRILKSHEDLLIRRNENEKTMIAWTGGFKQRGSVITAGFDHYAEKFTNSNRNGYLNYIYGQSLITPASFSNAQGSYLGNGQRSFSPLADNPLYMLDNPDGFFKTRHTQASLKFNHQVRRVTFYLNQSIESAAENMREGFRNGSAVSESGISRLRDHKTFNYILMAGGTGRIHYDVYKLNSMVLFNYVFSDLHHRISPEGSPVYRRQRTTHDILFSYQTTYQWSYHEAGLNLTQKMYFTNTSPGKYFLLPGINGYVRIRPNAKKLDIKISAGANVTRQDISTSQSFASAGWLRYRAAETGSFIPQEEPATINGILPQRVADANVQLECNYGSNFRFIAELMSKRTSNDIYAVPVQDELKLMNLSSTKMHGVEFSLYYNTDGSKRRAVSLISNISFFRAVSRITKVKEGYEALPIAGFSNVFKALVKGKTPGVIMGSDWLRDAAGQQIIGADGFPLVSPTLSVIGDPTPDFTMKFSHTITYKKFRFSADLEWRKGGDVWNGTAAVLDYYGRSANSASQRQTTGYVFPGVTINGQPNTTPVSFLDPSKPVEQNRWTRYGITGVASSYISKGDYIRLHTISLGYTWKFKKRITDLKISAYAENLFVWSLYPGVDPEKLLFDQAGTAGLDLFNLPSSRNAGIILTLQF
ncbi:MAG: hypothetical protein IPP73_11515 [Chitinophagaceae bacterium]|nr:hypothetical protein [Chitinophagaceae bacterium]